MNKLGRKFIILLADIPYLISWIIAANTHSIYYFYLVRVLVGLGDSCLLIALPAYIGEISSPKVRGTWGCLAPFNVCFGSLLVNALCGYLGIKTSAYILMSLPILSIITFVFMPESPYHLLIKGELEKAEISLQKLRRKSDVSDELFTLKKTIELNYSKKFDMLKVFRSKINLKALKVGLLGRVAQMVSGISAFSVYSQYFFQQAGGNLTPTLSSIIITLVVLLMIVPSAIIINKAGRRFSLITSCSLCTLILASMAIYFYMRDFTAVDLSNVTWYPLVGLIFYLIAHYVGLGLTPLILISEIFPTDVKAECLSIMNIVATMCVIAVNKLFPYLFVQFGMYAPFLFHFFCTSISTVLCILWIPETKGKSLEEIQQKLQGRKHSKPWNDITSL